MDRRPIFAALIVFLTLGVFAQQGTLLNFDFTITADGKKYETFIMDDDDDDEDTLVFCTDGGNTCITEEGHSVGFVDGPNNIQSLEYLDAQGNELEEGVEPAIVPGSAGLTAYSKGFWEEFDQSGKDLDTFVEEKYPEGGSLVVTGVQPTELSNGATAYDTDGDGTHDTMVLGGDCDPTKESCAGVVTVDCTSGNNVQCEPTDPSDPNTDTDDEDFDFEIGEGTVVGTYTKTIPGASDYPGGYDKLVADMAAEAGYGDDIDGFIAAAKESNPEAFTPDGKYFIAGKEITVPKKAGSIPPDDDGHVHDHDEEKADGEKAEPSKDEFSLGSEIEITVGGEKQKVKAVRKAKGLYTIAGSDGKIFKDSDGQSPIFDKDGNQVGVYDVESNTIIYTGGGPNADQEGAIRISSNGDVIDSNGNLMGKNFEVVDSSGYAKEAKNPPAFTVIKDGKTTIVGKDGKILTTNGQLFPNGAFQDNADNTFVDRLGGEHKLADRYAFTQEEGAVFPDGRGGYFITEEVDGYGMVELHHFPNGVVYGESSSLLTGRQDSKYIFGKETASGDIDYDEYDSCVTSTVAVGSYVCLDPNNGQPVFPAFGPNGERREVPKECQPGDKDCQAMLDAYNAEFSDGFFNNYHWRHFGDAVDTWVGYSSNRYFSVFYWDYEIEYYKLLNEISFVRAVLGGIDGVSGELCRYGVFDVTNSGGTFPEDGSGAYAFVAGQYSEYLNTTSGSSYYEYVFNIEVNPACPMQFNANVYSGGESKPLLLNIPRLEPGNESFDQKWVVGSETLYDTVCLEFTEISPGCLTNVGRFTPLCNRIISGEQVRDQALVSQFLDGFDQTRSQVSGRDQTQQSTGEVEINEEI